jgi:hypothetical protein
VSGERQGTNLRERVAALLETAAERDGRRGRRPLLGACVAPSRTPNGAANGAFFRLKAPSIHDTYLFSGAWLITQARSELSPQSMGGLNRSTQHGASWQ